METRANYVLIGIFTLLMMAGGVLFVLWAAGRDTTALVPYRILFSGSVSGLSRGAAVLYNGLKIGEVTSIALNPSDPSTVIAYVSVNEMTPINKDTRARLEFQGLTGVASVQMTGGRPDSERLVVEDFSNPPTIIAERSDYQDLIESAQRLSRRADQVLEAAETLFATNAEAIKSTISNVETFSRTLADNSGAVTTLISEGREAAQNIAALSAQARGMIDRLDKTAARLDSLLKGADDLVNSGPLKETIVNFAEAAKSVRLLADNLDRRSEEAVKGFDQTTGKGLRELEGLVIDGRKTLNEINRSLRDFERNPQKLLFGATPTIPDYHDKP